ncbi:MAG: hypothetical protein CM15mV24_0030 [Bellamyvirus sp.]|nr:MAG: hypothetical protein CM15mV24_0030 [Bellamyvirus sp.]
MRLRLVHLVKHSLLDFPNDVTIGNDLTVTNDVSIQVLFPHWRPNPAFGFPAADTLIVTFLVVKTSVTQIRGVGIGTDNRQNFI